MYACKSTLSKQKTVSIKMENWMIEGIDILARILSTDRSKVVRRVLAYVLKMWYENRMEIVNEIISQGESFLTRMRYGPSLSEFMKWMRKADEHVKTEVPQLG